MKKTTHLKKIILKIRLFIKDIREHATAAAYAIHR
jgi:hypothetical protein